MCDAVRIIHALYPFGTGLFILALLWIFRDFIVSLITAFIEYLARW